MSGLRNGLWSVLLVLLGGAVAVLLVRSGHVRVALSGHEELVEGREGRQCDGPVVYNKPHKTGSTTVQAGLLDWAEKSGRVGVKCSPFIEVSSVQLRECIPWDTSGCVVLATHLEMDEGTRALLRRRLGGEWVSVTSTRAPRERLLSLFMQEMWVNASVAQGRMGEMAEWMRRRNPWELYNYHTGEERNGSCPIGELEKAAVMRLVRQYDVVVDVGLPGVSGKILKMAGMSELPRVRMNRRGSTKLVVSEEVEEALSKVGCVEEEMHRLFRLRMASLFEKATHRRCVSVERHPKPCF